MIDKPLVPLVHQAKFAEKMGSFHINFSALNLEVDLAIGKFLKIPPEQAHLITSGMMFGPKARLLVDLIGRSDHPKKAAILAAFNKIRGNNKREIFAHGYIWSDESSVKFIERITSGEFKIKPHSFTWEEFSEHVEKFTTDCLDFETALGITDAERNAFGEATSSAARRA